MDTSLLETQITIGAVISFLLQVLKKSKWFPIFKEDGTRAANVFASILAAGVAITGIHYQFDSTAHTLLLTNISWTMIGTAAWHWLSQYVIQHGWYKLAFSGAPSPVLSIPHAVVGTTGSIGSAVTDALAIQKQQKIDAAKAALAKAQEDLKNAQQ